MNWVGNDKSLLFEHREIRQSQIEALSKNHLSGEYWSFQVIDRIEYAPHHEKYKTLIGVIEIIWANNFASWLQ